MLSLQLLRQDPERVIKALAKRNIDARPDIKSLLEKNEKRRKIQNESETLKAESNKIAKTIGNIENNIGCMVKENLFFSFNSFMIQISMIYYSIFCLNILGFIF